MDNINHFSYSMAKNIYRKGIDYAVALKLGAYHYASGGDPTTEVDFFLKNIQGYIGEAILVINWERLQNPRFGEHASWCKRFLDRVKEKTSVKSLIYMSASVLRMTVIGLRPRMPIMVFGLPVIQIIAIPGIFRISHTRFAHGTFTRFGNIPVLAED